jgi:GntR family transcriptional regulator/MocR family aminotransferase
MAEKRGAGDARPFMPAIIVDPLAGTPQFRQLYEGLAQAIREGQFAPGSRLPSTRALAEHLGVARNTAHLAFEQLIAEGYVEGRIGAGTFVASALPEQLLQVEPRGPIAQPAVNSARPLSRRTAKLLSIYPREPWDEAGRIRAFRVTPALDQFPRALWQRLLVRSWREGGAELLDYGWGHSGLSGLC